LAAAGVSTSGLLERRELVAACREVIARHPARIAVTAGTQAATVAAAGTSNATAAASTAAAGTAASPTSPAAAAAPAGSSTSAAAAGGAAAAASYGTSAEGGGGAAGGPRPGGGGDSAGDASGVTAAAAADHNPDAAAAAVDAAKQRGNEAFARGDFSKAVSHYTMALRLCTAPNAVLYSNRSAAYSGMSYYGKAQADAEEAARLDPRQPKYRCRLGVALLGQGQLREAEAAFQGALQLDPSYAAAVQGLADVRAAVARR
ncbi:hypothetical protein Agub_g8987, partial [Astrephomene gubernaculifera]